MMSVGPIDPTDAVIDVVPIGPEALGYMNTQSALFVENGVKAHQL